MRRYSIPFAVVVSLCGPARADDVVDPGWGTPADDEEPAPPPVGYTLDEEWNGFFRRLFDRGGRPDPDGAVQQRFDGDLYPEYDINLAIPPFPLRLERAWLADPSGARFTVQSLSEFELASVVQLKTRVSMGGHWTLGLAYDRLQDRVTHSDLVRMDFGYAPRGEVGPYGAISFTPRVEKIDVDAILALGYRHARWGDARVRVFAFDPFNNFAFALAKTRDKVLDPAVHQDELPLAATVELVSGTFRGVRGELYLGKIVRHETSFDKLDDRQSYLQALSGSLAGALLEWAPAGAGFPLHVGATATTFRTRTEREHDVMTAIDSDIREGTHAVRGYALATPWPNLELEAQVRWRSRPETHHFGTGADSARTDREWLYSLRGEWMISPHAGTELGLLRLERDTSGPPDANVDGNPTRIISRCVLRMGKVWVAFGASWDLVREGKGPFGGANMTMIVDLP